MREIDVRRTLNRIENMMDERGMTRRDLAKAIGISYNGIGQWWNSHDGGSVPTIHKLVDMAGIFNCKVDDLICIIDTDENGEEVDPESKAAEAAIKTIDHFLTVNAKTDAPAKETAKKALNKQVAMPLETRRVLIYRCPVCGTKAARAAKYCFKCGQRLKV